MLDLMELPINAEGRPVPHTSLEGGIPSGQSKPVWWRGWWERGCSSHCLANFRLKALTRSWVSVFTEVTICWTYELAALLPAIWLAPKAIGCSWPVCLTCCFHPSCWTSSLARNLSAIELPAWLLGLSGDTGEGGHFQLGCRRYKVMRTYWGVHMMLPSIDNVSILSPVSIIIKNVPLCLPQRGAPFPRLGRWAVGSLSARVSIHGFITLTTLFTVGPDISIKLLYNGCQELHWQRKSVPNTLMPSGQVTSLGLYLSSSGLTDGNFMGNLLSKFRFLSASYGKRKEHKPGRARGGTLKSGPGNVLLPSSQGRSTHQVPWKSIRDQSSPSTDQ